jgi:hypothetical protein
MQPSPPQNSTPLAKFFLTPNEQRLRAGWRLLAHFMLLTLFFSLGILFTIPIFLIAPQSAFVVSHLVGLVAITLSTYVARRWVDRRTIASLGLVWNRQAALDLAFGIVLAGLQTGLIFAIEWGCGWLRIESWSYETLGWGAVFAQLGLIFGVFIIVGWQEELLSRGYWLQNLEEGMRLPAALVISSFTFALGHLLNPNISWMAIVGLTAAGFFLAYGYLVTRQLWLPIGLHIGWNFFEGPIFGFPISGLTQFFSLFTASRSGPEWLTGGAFGPEAGLIQYPVLLLSIGLIYRYRRNRLQKPTEEAV